MQFRIDSDKEAALIKQKNEFQEAKISELLKEREAEVKKNI